MYRITHSTPADCGGFQLLCRAAATAMAPLAAIRTNSMVRKRLVCGRGEKQREILGPAFAELGEAAIHAGADGIAAVAEEYFPA